MPVRNPTIATSDSRWIAAVRAINAERDRINADRVRMMDERDADARTHDAVVAERDRLRAVTRTQEQRIGALLAERDQACAHLAESRESNRILMESERERDDEERLVDQRIRALANRCGALSARLDRHDVRLDYLDPYDPAIDPRSLAPKEEGS